MLNKSLTAAQGGLGARRWRARAGAVEERTRLLPALYHGTRRVYRPGAEALCIAAPAAAGALRDGKPGNLGFVGKMAGSGME